MLQLLVKKAGLYVNDVAVRFSRRAHLLGIFLRIGLFSVLRKLEISSAIASRAACEAADPRECQDCFRAHGCDDIRVLMLRHHVVELPPVLELRHSPRIFNPHACNLRVKFWRQHEDVPSALHGVLQRRLFVPNVRQVAEYLADVLFGVLGDC